jgi:dephospho-CoA kinase
VRVALSGGVGAGKSTVSAMLAARGAVVIDADAVAREVVEPGTPGFDAVVAHFGERVVRDGRLDRPAVAAIVFSDESQRQALNAIVHPLVAARSAELMAQAPPDAVVVYDVPLLVESNLGAGFDVVVMVLASEATRLRRLAARGMSPEDARARIAAQADDDARRAVADEVVINDGQLEDLQRQVAALWERLLARRDTRARP